MNKVITINLDGDVYQLEEGGYDALLAYLETATARLANNPDRDEILSDIERAIADKVRAHLARHKTVIEAKEVAAVLSDMGPIDVDFGEAREAGAGTGVAGEARGSASSGPPRRLYRIHEGSMMAGVCNGIAAYVNLDPSLVRIGFVLLTIFWGTGFLVYVVMAIVVPEARSPEEMSAASGISATAQEFIRRAKEGYYEAMKKFPDRKAHREWGRQFKRAMRANADQWSQNWRSRWAGHTPVHPGMGFALPFLSSLYGVAMILFICTLISMLATGAVFGRPLPRDLPVWGASVVLLLVYGVLAEPLKQARRACYRDIGSPGSFWSFVFLLDAVIWLAVVVTLVYLGARYFPEVRDAFHSIPSLVHRAEDDIRTWWNQK